MHAIGADNRSRRIIFMDLFRESFHWAVNIDKRNPELNGYLLSLSATFSQSGVQSRLELGLRG